MPVLFSIDVFHCGLFWHSGCSVHLVFLFPFVVHWGLLICWLIVVLWSILMWFIWWPGDIILMMGMYYITVTEVIPFITVIWRCVLCSFWRDHSDILLSEGYDAIRYDGDTEYWWLRSLHYIDVDNSVIPLVVTVFDCRCWLYLRCSVVVIDPSLVYIDDLLYELLMMRRLFVDLITVFYGWFVCSITYAGYHLEIIPLVRLQFGIVIDVDLMIVPFDYRLVMEVPLSTTLTCWLLLFCGDSGVVRLFSALPLRWRFGGYLYRYRFWLFLLVLILMVRFTDDYHHTFRCRCSALGGVPLRLLHYLRSFVDWCCSSRYSSTICYIPWTFCSPVLWLLLFEWVLPVGQTNYGLIYRRCSFIPVLVELRWYRLSRYLPLSGWLFVICYLCCCTLMMFRVLMNHYNC